MVIIGLDPGIARTGYGILNTDSSDLFVQCGCLTTPPQTPLPQRLLLLAKYLETLLLNFSPSVAAVESIYFGANTKTAILTAQARGALILTLARHNIPTHTLTPLQIKSQLTSYGKADKYQVQSLVAKRLNLSTTPQPDDAADALAAAICLVDNNSCAPNISSNQLI